MAKKSVANKVRAYLRANPEASSKDIAEKFGIQIEYAYVLRSQWRKLQAAEAIPQEKIKLEWNPPEPLPAPPVAPVKTDMVNHPPHYKAGGIETIDFIEAKQLDYHLGNVVKYISRSGRKEDAVEDLKKARWYLDRAIETRSSTAA